MPDLITVSVTAEDLACGWGDIISPAPRERDRRDCDYCPLEHALTRAVGEQVLTNGVEAWLERRSKEGGKVSCVVLPEQIQIAAQYIDKGMKVKPFTFEMERPK